MDSALSFARRWKTPASAERVGLAEARGNNYVSSLPLNGAGAEGPTESVSISGGARKDAGLRAAGVKTICNSGFQEFPRSHAARRWRRFSRAAGGGGFRRGLAAESSPSAECPRDSTSISRMECCIFSDDNAGLDARPYSLTGIEAPKADYNQAHFGGETSAAPLNIPKIFNGGNKWFFLWRMEWIARQFAIRCVLDGCRRADETQRKFCGGDIQQRQARPNLQSPERTAISVQRGGE